MYVKIYQKTDTLTPAGNDVQRGMRDDWEKS